MRCRAAGVAFVLQKARPRDVLCNHGVRRGRSRGSAELAPTVNTFPGLSNEDGALIRTLAGLIYPVNVKPVGGQGTVSSRFH